MKKLIILFCLSGVVIIWLSCTTSSGINVAIPTQKTNDLINKTEFTLTESEPINFKKGNGEIDNLIEPSGVVAIDKEGKNLLVVDDKVEDDRLNNIRVFNSIDGSLVNKSEFAIETENPKWEAVAKDGEDYFVIGSHAGDTKKKVQRRSVLFRFNLKQNQDGRYELDKSQKPIKFDIVESLKNIEIDGKKIYDGEPTQPNVEPQKAKIEGLAIKKINDKRNLIIGFREPDSLVRIYSAEIPTEINQPVNLTLKQYFSFNAGKTSDNIQFKLSSLEYVPEIKGFIVLTSSETTAADGKTPIFHGNAMWLIKDEQIETAQIENGFKSIGAVKIAEFQKDYKAEGICALPSDNSNKFKFAIVFDNDVADQTDKKKYVGKMELVELSKNTN